MMTMQHHMAWVLLLFSLQGLAQGPSEPTKCPDGLFTAARVARTCLRSLPWSGMIWMRDRDGEPCSCECPERSISTASLMRLRDSVLQHLEAAQDRYAGGTPWQKRARSLLFRVSPLQEVSVHAANVGPDGITDLIPLNAALLCEDHDDLLFALRHLQASGVIPEFRVIIVDDNLNDAFPSISDVGGTNWIKFPPVFLRSPHVGIELLEFMLLHELGHGYTESSDECMADQYAADVGMRALYPGPALIFILEEVMKQYLAYSRQIAGTHGYIPLASPPTYGVADCSSVGRYPAYECRRDAVIQMRECFSSDLHSDCPIAYHDSCWLPPYEEKEYNPSPDDVMCALPTACEALNRNDNNDLSQELRILDAIQTSQPMDLFCEKYPSICRLWTNGAPLFEVCIPHDRPEPKGTHAKHVRRSLDRALKKALRSK